MHLDPIYRRGIAEINLGDFGGAVADLEAVISREPKYDSHRAMALLAHAYANTGQNDKAAALFEQVTQLSTLSETCLNYATFLASQNRKPKPVSGPNVCWRGGRPCPATCSGASGRGSGKPRRC